MQPAATYSKMLEYPLYTDIDVVNNLLKNKTAVNTKQ